MNPIVSICIITYNRANYLEELLHSVYSLDVKYLEQIEIIVLDNGSTDESSDVMNSYIQSRNTRTLRFENNKRGSAPYLKLISEAKGEFLIFPGDDDVFITDSIIKLIEVCHSTPLTTTLIAFGAKTIDSVGKANFYRYSPPLSFIKPEIVAKLLFDSMFWMPATIFKKSAVSNKADPLTITAFDWWIWLSAVCTGEIQYIDMPLVKYRQHGGQEQKSYLQINWEIDSLLMLYRTVTEVVTPWLISEKEETRDKFFQQISFELQQINFDKFQTIKWTMLISIISQSINTKEFFHQLKTITQIWDDPRFIETWFNLELTTVQILDFYNSWGVSTETPSGISRQREVFGKKQVDSKDSLIIYELEKNGMIQFDIRLQFNGINHSFEALNEINLQLKLKELSRNVLYRHREIEISNQITPIERKIISVYRKIKSYKIINFIR